MACTLIVEEQLGCSLDMVVPLMLGLESLENHLEHDPHAQNSLRNPRKLQCKGHQVAGRLSLEETNTT